MAFVSMIDLIYSVGSIYESMSSTSPATLFGGTWSSIVTFLYGSTAAGKTGGEAEHCLTIEEMPYHDHGVNEAWCGYGDWTAGRDDTLSYSKHAAENTGRTGCKDKVPRWGRMVITIFHLIQPATFGNVLLKSIIQSH